MATVWGGWAYSGGGEFFRLGIADSGTTLIVYIQTGSSSWISGTHTLSRGGPWAGSASVPVNTSGAVTTELYRQNVGQTNGTYTASMSISGVTASVSRSISFVAKPGAPSGLTHTRQGGRATTATWNAGAGATDYGVQTGQDNATPSTKLYTSTRAYKRTDYPVDSLVQMRVFSRNSAGNSAYSNMISFYTTPKTPAKPTLTRTENGVLVGSSGPKYPYGLEYKRSDEVTGSAGTGTSALAPYSVLDSNAGGANLTYRVRAFVGPASDRVYSDWSPASDPISTLSAPNPPTLTAPNGVVKAGSVGFAWRHNPTDTSGQQSAKIRYRVKGATAWTTKTVTGSAQSTSITLSADQYEYQVQTKGLADNYSDWSAVGSFQVISAPIVEITSPTGNITTAVLAVQWVTGQAEGLPQSAWKARLYDNDQNLLDEKSGTGATVKTTFTPRAVDGGIYRIVVETATSGVWSAPEQTTFQVSFLPPPKPIGNVVWDESAGCHRISIEPADSVSVRPIRAVLSGGIVSFNDALSMVRPTNLALRGKDVYWDDETPGDDLFAAIDPVTGNIVAATFTELWDATAYLGVQRSIDGGDTWETVAENLPPQTLEIEDYQGLSSGTTLYRLTAYTALEAQAINQISVVSESQAFWLAVGNDYSLIARLPANAGGPPPLGNSPQRERSSEEYEGRTWGVPYAGTTLRQEITTSGVLVEGNPDFADWRTLEQIAFAPQPIHLLRTPLGQRVYGKLGEVPLNRTRKDQVDYQISVSRTESPIMAVSL